MFGSSDPGALWFEILSSIKGNYYSKKTGVITRGK